MLRTFLAVLLALIVFAMILGAVSAVNGSQSTVTYTSEQTPAAADHCADYWWCK